MSLGHMLRSLCSSCKPKVLRQRYCNSFSSRLKIIFVDCTQNLIRVIRDLTCCVFDCVLQLAIILECLSAILTLQPSLFSKWQQSSYNNRTKYQVIFVKLSVQFFLCSVYYAAKLCRGCRWLNCIAHFVCY